MTNEERVQEIQNGVNVQDNMQQLYDLNSGLIFQYVHPYTLSGAEQDDLMQEAFFGLHEAVKRYDPGQGSLFMTYASYWIRSAVSRYCNNCIRTKRVPVHMEMLIRKFKRFCSEYRLMKETDPDDTAICEGMGISEDTLKRIRKTMFELNCISIDSLVPGSENNLTFGDVIPDDFDLEAAVTDQEAERQDRELLWQLVQELPERQQDIILKHFREGLSLRDIAADYGISYQRVSQLESKGLKTLKNHVELKQIAMQRGIDSIDPVAYHGGVRRFRRTGTSSTEAAALNNLETQDSIIKILILKAELEAEIAALKAAQQSDQEGR